MKRTIDGNWAHVSCALWIPESGFDNVTTMEPISKLDVPLLSFFLSSFLSLSLSLSLFLFQRIFPSFIVCRKSQKADGS